jgi:hypothetical protein
VIAAQHGICRRCGEPITYVPSRGMWQHTVAHTPEPTDPGDHLPFIKVEDPALIEQIERLRKQALDEGAKLRAREQAPLWRRVLMLW